MFNKRVETPVPVYSNGGPLIQATNKLSGKKMSFFPLNLNFEIPVRNFFSKKLKFLKSSGKIIFLQA